MYNQLQPTNISFASKRIGFQPQYPQRILLNPQNIASNLTIMEPSTLFLVPILKVIQEKLDIVVSSPNLPPFLTQAGTWEKVI